VASMTGVSESEVKADSLHGGLGPLPSAKYIGPDASAPIV